MNTTEPDEFQLTMGLDHSHSYQTYHHILQHRRSHNIVLPLVVSIPTDPPLWSSIASDSHVAWTENETRVSLLST